jgi:hypothetical protein
MSETKSTHMAKMSKSDDGDKQALMPEEATRHVVQRLEATSCGQDGNYKHAKMVANSSTSKL